MSSVKDSYANSSSYTNNELQELEKIKNDLILTIFETKDKRWAIDLALKKAFDLGRNIAKRLSQ